ncbi:MAG: hypothetical protein QHJ73_00295, partial [Armatimonadota bacterium]|nr:hypothetical protein [Armatimonadota bacterium]
MSRVAHRIGVWLREHQLPDGRVRDPLHGDCGTYAAGFAALVFGLLAAGEGSGVWEDACRRSLQAARGRPLHSEFDQLALLLLARHCPSAGVSPLPRLYRGRRLVSHNWVAMRALNHSLRAHLGGNRSDAHAARVLW